MKKVVLTMCAVMVVVSLSSKAAIDTAWFRFEEGSAGANIGSLANSGSGADEPCTTGNGVDLYSSDGAQPVYSPDLPGSQIQAGAGGTTYTNSLSDYTPKTNYSTGNYHGSGYIALRGYTSGQHSGFCFNNWVTATIELFYKVPNSATLTQAQNNWQRILYFAPQNIPPGKTGYEIDVRHEPENYGNNKVVFLVDNRTGPQARVEYEGFTAGEWHHIAIVLTGDANDLPAGYEKYRMYVYVDYQLVGSTDISSYGAQEHATQGWFGAWPWWKDDHWEFSGREDCTAMGYYDEIRITYNSHGTHLGGAALTPDQFLRAVPEPATIGLAVVGMLGLISKKR